MKSNKKIIITGLLMVAIILAGSVVGYGVSLGENPKRNDVHDVVPLEEKFIGTWKYVFDGSPEQGGYYEIFLIISSDGTYTSAVGGDSSSGTWEIEDNYFVITESVVTKHSYEFSDKDMTLSLTTLDSDITMVYHKQ